MKDNSDGTEMSTEMDILDFLLCINLLSTIPIDLKIQSKFKCSNLIFCVDMFDICDNDDDGCMNPYQILQML